MAGRVRLDDRTRKARQQGGLWLRRLRDEAGLSQRDLARLVDIEFYAVISQVEIGKGLIPPEKYAAWSRALNIDGHEFAINIVKYYHPFLHDLLFPAGDSRRKAGATAAPTADIQDLNEQIRELYRLLGEQTLDNARLRRRLPPDDGAAASALAEAGETPTTASKARAAPRKRARAKE